MKGKIVVAILIMMLMIASAFASAANINLKETSKSSDDPPVNYLADDPIPLNVADMVIVSTESDATIILKDLVLDIEIPDQQTIVKVNFYANCIIEDERLNPFKPETWIFTMKLKEYAGSTIYIDETIVKEDEWIETFPYETTISGILEYTRDPDSWMGGPWEEPYFRYSLTLECAYYYGDHLEDDDIEYANPVVDLVNKDPCKPKLSGPTSGKVGTPYTFTISSDGDPEGDEIRYYIGWDDGTSGYVSGWMDGSSPSSAEASHTWESQGTFTINFWTEDCFWEQNWGDSITVTMPRSGAIFRLMSLDFLYGFPLLEKLLNLLIQ